MLTVTEKALEVLASVIDRSETTDAAVRIVARSDGWSMAMDAPTPDDEKFEHDQRTVLVLDSGVAETLQDRTLDVRETPQGLKLGLR